MAPRTLPIPIVFLLLIPLVTRADLPTIPDSWTDYPTATAAVADGWTRECALSQAITVDADCVVGIGSVGCRAMQARWCNEFGLEKSVSLAGLTHLRFRQKASWIGLNFQVRLTMEPSAAEAAQGVEIKRLTWSMPTQTAWTTESFAVEDGQWSWRVNGMWQSSGYETSLTQMVGVRWFFCTYFGITVGDCLLIDDLALVQDSSPAASAVFDRCTLWPNPFNPCLRIRLEMPQAVGSGTVAIHDLAGHRLRLLRTGPLDCGPVSLSWDGCDGRGGVLPSGEYLVVLEAEGRRVTRKVTLVR